MEDVYHVPVTVNCLKFCVSCDTFCCLKFINRLNDVDVIVTRQLWK